MLLSLPVQCQALPRCGRRDVLQCEVPPLRCFEHAAFCMQISSNRQPKCSSQRGSPNQEATLKVPGTQDSGRTGSLPRCMSDMSHMRWTEGSGLSSSPRHAHARHDVNISSGRHMPGMTLGYMVCVTGRNMPDMMSFQCSFYCICIHVGYTKPDSRLRTCPGQRAHINIRRSATCSGQRAHHPYCRSVTCPGQSAQQFRSRQLTCSEQRSQLTLSNCPGQQDRQMAQSREYGARIDDSLEELKFWTMSVGCEKSPRLPTRSSPKLALLGLFPVRLVEGARLDTAPKDSPRVDYVRDHACGGHPVSSRHRGVRLAPPWHQRDQHAGHVSQRQHEGAHQGHLDMH